MCAFSGLLFSFCSPLRQQSLSCCSIFLFYSAPPLFPSVSYLLSAISLHSNSLCYYFLPYTIHVSEEISHPKGNLKSVGVVQGENKETLSISFQNQAKRNGAPSPFFNHFLCWSIEHGISKCRGQVHLLYSLRTCVNKTASR